MAGGLPAAGARALSTRASKGQRARALRRAASSDSGRVSLPAPAPRNGAAAEVSFPAAATGSVLAGRRPGLYSTHIGKKYAMAVSGMVLMLFVRVHMLGNLKLYQGAGAIDSYAAWLRRAGAPVLPRDTLLWLVGILLVAAGAIHIHSACTLTLVNRRARPEAYRSPRDYVAASFASRTMRWTGIIVALFVIFHLLDLTWGTVNPSFRAGGPYHNIVASFRRWPVGVAYGPRSGIALISPPLDRG